MSFEMYLKTLKVSVICFLLPCLVPSQASSREASVLADGQTATVVNTLDNGSTVVDIAPASSAGISHNSYEYFNVPSSGVGLNNTFVLANTIINEVTSANPSLIEGPLQVLGPRADVVLANPYGITVNGGSFINTGRLALAGARLLNHAETPSLIHLQTSAGGYVHVGSEGLSGDIIELELLAQTIRVDGDMNGLQAQGDIRLMAGDMTAVIDTEATDYSRSWLSEGIVEENSNPALWAVDIGSGATLNGFDVYIIVTDIGAGVRIDQSTIQAGEVSIETQGDVLLSGASIGAVEDIQITGAFVGMRSMSRDKRTRLLADNGSIILSAGADIVNAMGELVTDGDIVINAPNGSFLNIAEDRKSVV